MNKPQPSAPEPGSPAAQMPKLPMAKPGDDLVYLNRDPSVLAMDDALTKAFALYGLPRMGGASGRGWSFYSSLQKCLYYHYRAYCRDDRGAPAHALELGSCVHTYLALHYQGMRDPANVRLTPERLKDELIKLNASADIVMEAWRLFQAYETRYESDYLIPLAEELLLKAKDGSSCRYDLIARVEEDVQGVAKGTWVTEHKCLTGDTTICDRTLGVISLSEAFATEWKPVVQAWNGEAFVWAQAEVHPDCVREIHRVRTSSGRYLDASDNHPFLTAKGWVPVAELTCEDWIAVPARTNVGSDAAPPLTVDEIEFLGLMLGDGSFVRKISFCKGGPTMERFRAVCGRLGWKLRDDQGPPAHTEQVVLSQALDAGPRTLLSRLGLYGLRSPEKFVPQSLLAMPARETAVLLSSLWDTDGCVDVFDEHRSGKASQRKVRIAYTSRSEQLCRDVQVLLLRLGVPSTVRASSVEYDGERRPFWATKVVTRVGKRAFLTLVSVTKYGGLFIEEARTAIKDGDDRLIPTDRIRHVPETGVERHQLLRKRRAVEAGTVARVLGERARKYLDEPIRWERVESIVAAGRRMTYNVSVPSVHTFVANDIVTHNSASRFDTSMLEGWKNDGEIIGQIRLYKKAKLAKRFGKLQGVIVNLIGKQKVPQFQRIFIPVENWKVKQHEKDLKAWEMFRNICATTNTWPRSRASCVGRYGLCAFFDHCAQR